MASMLDEIPSESLSTVRRPTASSLIVRAMSESFQLFSLRRRSSHGEQLSVGLESLVDSGTVLEIRGAPSSGKTHLLYFLVLLCILPERYGTANLGGKGKAAVVLDMDLSFDATRFHQLLRDRVIRLLPFDVDGALPVVNNALEKLHIFRPRSTSELVATISHLPHYHATHLQDSEIGLLAIDSISANYWQDCYVLEQMATSPASDPLRCVMSVLDSLQETSGFTIVLTSWALPPMLNRNKDNHVPIPTAVVHPFSTTVRSFVSPPRGHPVVISLSHQKASSHGERRIYGWFETLDGRSTRKLVINILPDQLLVNELE